MKRIKFLFAFLTLFLVSGVAFGQRYMIVQDYFISTVPSCTSSIPPPNEVFVNVTRHSSNGNTLSKTVQTTFHEIRVALRPNIRIGRGLR